MDIREAILARLLTLAGTVGAYKVERNLNDFSDLARPAIVILDGDEEAHEDDPQVRPSSAPRRIVMTPEIVVLASGPAAAIGSTINGFRIALLRAIMLDQGLIALVLDGTTRQSIRYVGAELSLQSGRAIEAELRLNFSFTYRMEF